MRKDLKNELYEPEMPPLDMGGVYLIEYFWEVGPAMSGGFSMSPITNAELRAWQHNIGISLQPWEARVLRRLSTEYIAESHDAEERDAIEPFKKLRDEAKAEDLARVARSMRQAIEELAKL